VNTDDALEQQATLIAALTDPVRYPHPVDTVDHLETHISHILLAGDYAYKIKKPVNLGFLDFTSLARRRTFCEEELRLNRRLAPDLYLDCIAIGARPDAPVLGCMPDQAIEFAVKMRRFPQAALLDRCLDEGRLETRQLDALAHRLAEFHTNADRAGQDTPFGAPERVLQPALDNFNHCRQLLSDPATVTDLATLEHWTKTTHQALYDTFAARKAGGFIREGHGDMHLGNMLLKDDRILVFDGIEFNDDLRWIDVMNDLAFLCMDLHYRRVPELAWRLLNGYLEVSGDYAGLAVLSYYQTYRALVRTKVAAIRLSQPDLTPEQQADAQTECRSHLALALQFIQRKTPFLLITHGLSGSGKTTLTTPLLERLGAVRIRSDVERKRLFGLSPLARSESMLDQGIYTADASERTYQRLYELAEGILTAGFPVMVDATFLERSRRQHFRELAARLGAPFVLLVCSAEPEELRARLMKRQERGEDAAEADSKVLERQLRDYRPPGADEQPVLASGNAIDSLQQAILSTTNRST